MEGLLRRGEDPIWSALDALLGLPASAFWLLLLVSLLTTRIGLRYRSWSVLTAAASCSIVVSVLGAFSVGPMTFLLT